LRLILDTNVWLDWLLFDDPSVAALKAAVAEGRAEIFIDAAGEAELARVLAYDLGKHSIGAEKQAACLADCRRIAKPLTDVLIDGTGLPRCADAADQVFLEAAVAARADYLVTKDRELLELARRKLPFQIVRPSALNFT
jgi:putative PIN family toxin of toxin-antitoxin system